MRMNIIPKDPVVSAYAVANASTLFRRRHKFRIRLTLPRLQVLQAMESLGQKDVRCSDICLQLENAGMPLAEAAVYRAAREMARAGLLTRAPAADGLVAYSLNLPDAGAEPRAADPRLSLARPEPAPQMN